MWENGDEESRIGTAMQEAGRAPFSQLGWKPPQRHQPQGLQECFCCRRRLMKTSWKCLLYLLHCPLWQKCLRGFLPWFLSLMASADLRLLRAHHFWKFRWPSIHAEKSSFQYLSCHSKISGELSAWKSIKAEELNQHCWSLGWWLQNF